MKRPIPKAHAGFFFLCLVFALVVLYPLGMTLAESLRAGEGVSFRQYLLLLDVSNRVNMEAVANSVGVSLLSVFFSGIVGVFLAFVYTQFEFSSKAVLSRLAVLPVALPPLVGVIAFLFIFGESGIIPRGLHMLFRTESAPLVATGIAGVVLVHVYSFHVYFYLFVAAAFRSIDRSLLEAAAGFGSGAWATFRRVVMPELRPALLAASALTFMASMASFTAPLLFAGNRHFITLQIYATKLNGDLDLAAAQSVLLTAVSLLFYVILTAGPGRDGKAFAHKGATMPGVLTVPRGARRAMIGVALLIAGVELLPVGAILLLSLAREGSWTTQWLPSAFTADNYVGILKEPALLRPLLNSVVMAAVALGASLLFGIPAAYLVTKRGTNSWRIWANILLTMPYAVPGTVVAVALILAFNSPTLLGGSLLLVGTFWIVPLAYFVREYALVVRSVSASLERLDDSLLEAAESLGAGAWRKFRGIVLPAILPGIVSGGVLVLIASLGEFVASILLYTYASRPVSVEIFAQLRLFNIGTSAALSVVLMLLVLLLLWSSARLSARRGEEGMRDPLVGSFQ